MIKLLPFLFLIFPLSLAAQPELAIGQWRSHLPYQHGRYVTQSPSTIYFATDLSLLTIDKEEGSVDFISTVDGLSNTGIGVIKYNSFSDILIVTYNNSVIDLVKPHAIVTLTDIRNFTNQVIDKSINDIYIHSASEIFIAAGYGVSKLNIEADIFEFTSFTGVKIKSITVFEGELLAATNEGIYATPLNNPFIQDFASWRAWGPDLGFPEDYTTTVMAVNDGQLYFDLNDSLYTLLNNQPHYVYHQSGLSIQYLTSEGTHLLLGMRCLPNCKGKVVRIKNGNIISNAGGACDDRPLHAIEDERGKVWFADDFRGIRVSNDFTSRCINTVYNSPFSEASNEIKIADNKVYVASGGLKDNGNNLGRADGMFSFIDGEWKAFNERNFPELKERDANRDFYRIAIHPDNGKVYAGTYYGGIVVFEEESIEIIYNETNSTLQGAIGDLQRERVSGLAFDKDNNLWVSNHSAPKPISVFKEDGSWLSFNVNSDKRLDQLVIDGFGYKWFIVVGTGILVFDDNGTLENVNDDRFRLYTESNSTLQSSIVNCLEVDRDGKVWAGTSNGVVVYECDPFNPECVGGLIIVEENEIDEENEYLLKGEDVKSISVDGANRKWFGTTSGVFVQSPNARDQVATFNITNSPLLDNRITDIAINHQSGEVFIGTSKGIISYRGEATEGGFVNNVNAYAFPNPVRPDYQGLIAIKGLAENANIKITDIKGQLIYETEALGGQAIWDGRDYNGRRASSGVYLVFATKIDLNNPDTLITKILFIN